MSMEETYGPEDIEQLLLSKDFSELYPEEKAYILLHMEDEAEYNSLRLMLRDVSSSKDDINPPVAMRDALISMHESRHKSSSFKIWLNSVFAVFALPADWKRPAMQLAGLAGAIILVVIVYQTVAPEVETGELAYKPEQKVQAPPSVTQEELEENPSHPSESAPKADDKKLSAPKEEVIELENSENILANQSSMEEKKDSEADAEFASAEIFDTEVVILESDEVNLEEAIVEFTVEEEFADEEELDDDEVFVSANRTESRENRADAEESPAMEDLVTSSSLAIEALGITDDRLSKTATAIPNQLISQLYTAW